MPAPFIVLLLLSADPQPDRFFEEKVRPILAGVCFECHGGKETNSGLRVDSRDALLRGGDSGPAAKAGDPKQSLLIEAIGYGDSIQMPPKEKLPADQIAALTRWVEMGMPWPKDDSPWSATSVDPHEHWAFQPVRRPTVPSVVDPSWLRTPVDAFILAELQSAGLTPSAPTDRRTLLRRVMFDLVGLPPTAEQVAQFLNDRNPDAFERVVDQLLASPAYGERWARHWLDLARYSDTKGYVFTEDRKYPFAFTYRDWVVRAFNEDLPFDRFVVSQIAADQLPENERQSALPAMGFLTLGRRFLNNRHDIIDDRIDVVTRGLMGLTVTCARCHSHKYDPIPTEDYYSLYGVFASCREPKESSQAMVLEESRLVEPVVFLRGNPGNHGEKVPRQFLKVVAGDKRQPFKLGSGRLELAQAIVDPANPLTARVFVNRVWMHHFGQPLVSTTSDFGVRSDPPSHPELLDYLADEFVRSKWSVKHLHRLLVLSATYRQSSMDNPVGRARNPDNRLCWRMNRRRVDLEAMRDGMLTVAGTLDQRIGGPSVDLTTSPFSHRRTIYGYIDRQNLPAMYRTFDFANPDTHSPYRHLTTVPQQTLFLRNHPLVAEQAAALLARGEVAGTSDSTQRIERLYQIVYQRSPAKEELDLAMQFVHSTPASSEGVSKPMNVWEEFAQALLLTNEFLFID